MCFLPSLLLLIHKCRTKLPQSNCSQYTQSSGKRLETSPNRTRNAASCQNDTREESELHAVALSVIDAVGAEQVEGADSAACCYRGNGAGADVACDAAACCEGTEDEGDCAERVVEFVRRERWL